MCKVIHAMLVYIQLVRALKGTGVVQLVGLFVDHACCCGWWG